MTTKHTPTPWKLTRRDVPQATAFDTYAEGSDCSSISGVIESARGTFVADTQTEGKTGASKVIALRNAEFIVRACNAHEALSAALRKLVDFAGVSSADTDKYNLYTEVPKSLIEEARAALAEVQS